MSLTVILRRHFLHLQSFLQGEGHLLNIADVVKLELPPKSFDQFDNDVVETSDTSFTKVRPARDGLAANGV